MGDIRVTSIFQTLRPCLKCGAEFYPPKRANRRIADYCSFECEKVVGLRAAERFYRKLGESASRIVAPKATEPRIRIVARTARHRVTAVRTTRSRFATNIAARRRARGWTQQALADRLDVARESVRRWELDQGEPSAMHLGRLADIFETSMDDLWRGGASRQERAS